MTNEAMQARIATAKAWDQADDPGPALDSSYSEQLELLMKVRRAVADVRESRERLELQMDALRREQSELHAEADRTSDARGPRLRRGVVRRRAAIEGELSRLAARYALLCGEEERLASACIRLDVKVGAFRVKKEVIKAVYAAGEAMSRVSEAFFDAADVTSNPRMLANSREQGLAALGQVGRGMRELSGCRERMECEIEALRQRQAQLDDEARQALGAGREDLARQTLEGKAAIGGDLSDYAEQLHSMRADEDRIAAAYERLAVKVQPFPQQGHATSDS